MSEGKPWVIASLPKLGEITVAANELTRLRLVEAAAREVLSEFTMTSELDGAEQRALEALRAALEGADADANARALYKRTAVAMGFVNAPPWEELADETRQLYREEFAKRSGASLEGK